MKDYSVALYNGNVTFKKLSTFKFDDVIEFRVFELACLSLDAPKVPSITMGLCIFGRYKVSFHRLSFQAVMLDA
jgi:hypothetical protein